MGTSTNNIKVVEERPYKVVDKVIRKARKSCKCTRCGKLIDSGQSYTNRWFHFFDDEPSYITIHLCTVCLPLGDF